MSGQEESSYPSFYTYTCTGCKDVLDPHELDEYGHVCDGWWDDHSIYDEIPRILVSANRDFFGTVDDTAVTA